MIRRRDPANVVVKQGHSLHWDADSEVYTCEACGRLFYKPSDLLADEWCDC